MDEYRKQLNAALTERGWTPTRLSQELEVTRAAAWWWCQGRRVPNPASARRIEEILGVPAAIIHPDVFGPARQDPAA
jgi:transcriptional regulator with XRE-family HTH domain